MGNFDAVGVVAHQNFQITTTGNGVTRSLTIADYSKKFVGPTTAYAFMQAMGLVNDHVEDCVIRARVESARREFKRP